MKAVRSVQRSGRFELGGKEGSGQRRGLAAKKGRDRKLGARVET